jgi:hypothetical protein
MKQDFDVTFTGRDGRSTVCLVALADAWRRGASFDRPQLAAQFNREARKLCAAVQWLDLDRAAGWPGEKTRAALDGIEKLARANGIERVILPVYGESFMGELLGAQIAKGGVARRDLFEAQELPYLTRLHTIGRVDKRRKTALDYKLAYIAD